MIPVSHSFSSTLTAKKNSRIYSCCALTDRLSVPVCDSAVVQIVRRDLDGDSVSGKNTNVVHAELSAQDCSDLMSVLQLYLKGIRHCVRHKTIQLNCITLTQTLYTSLHHF